MRLLITGGCGFLGSNLAAAALDRGDEMVLFDNLHRSGSLDNLNWLQNKGNFTFEHGDTRNANDISQVIKSFRPDLIFHLAGAKHAPEGEVNTWSTLDINSNGT